MYGGSKDYAGRKPSGCCREIPYGTEKDGGRQAGPYRRSAAAPRGRASRLSTRSWRSWVMARIPSRAEKPTTRSPPHPVRRQRRSRQPSQGLDAALVFRGGEDDRAPQRAIKRGGKGADDAGLVDANEFDKAKWFETNCVGAEGVSPIRWRSPSQHWRAARGRGERQAM